MNMTPRQVLEKWIDAFNLADVDAISELYANNAVNHPVANDPIVGNTSVRQMFTDEFSNAVMVCIPESIFQYGEWAIWEWVDTNGHRGLRVLSNRGR